MRRFSCSCQRSAAVAFLNIGTSSVVRAHARDDGEQHRRPHMKNR
jgi:hypothetical protein